MKVLALDYGRARTGVAVSDPTGTIARPLCVVEEAATDDATGSGATSDTGAESTAADASIEV